MPPKRGQPALQDEKEVEIIFIRFLGVIYYYFFFSFRALPLKKKKKNEELQDNQEYSEASHDDMSDGSVDETVSLKFLYFARVGKHIYYLML